MRDSRSGYEPFGLYLDAVDDAAPKRVWGGMTRNASYLGKKTAIGAGTIAVVLMTVGLLVLL